MHINRRRKGRWEQLIRFCKARILHVNDSSHRIALGVAIGIFVGWTPIIGPHMILALVLCALLKANKLVGVASVWINNPLTAGFMWGPSYFVGKAVVNLWRGPGGLSNAEFWELIGNMESIGGILTNFHRARFWQDMFKILMKIGAELWIGCLIVGFFAAIAGYFITRYLVIWHRRRSPHRRYMHYT